MLCSLARERKKESVQRRSDLVVASSSLNGNWRTPPYRMGPLPNRTNVQFKCQFSAAILGVFFHTMDAHWLIELVAGIRLVLAEFWSLGKNTQDTITENSRHLILQFLLSFQLRTTAKLSIFFPPICFKPTEMQLEIHFKCQRHGFTKHMWRKTKGKKRVSRQSENNGTLLGNYCVVEKKRCISCKLLLLFSLLTL